jgi:hypothetical protein
MVTITDLQLTGMVWGNADAAVLGDALAVHH